MIVQLKHLHLNDNKIKSVERKDFRQDEKESDCTGTVYVLNLTCLVLDNNPFSNDSIDTLTKLWPNNFKETRTTKCVPLFSFSRTTEQSKPNEPQNQKESCKPNESQNQPGPPDTTEPQKQLKPPKQRKGKMNYYQPGPKYLKERIKMKKAKQEHK